MMPKLSLQDIWPNQIYETARAELRAQVIALKRQRRLALTDQVTLVFENRETLRFQVQEILRAEGVGTPAAVQAELDVYNAMLPGRDHLQATLFVEVIEEARVPAVLHAMLGLERAVSLRFGQHRVPATFEDGRSDGQRISAVQYLQFRFDAAQRAAFLAAAAVEVVVDHAAARGTAKLSAAGLKSLQGDLQAE